MIPFILGNVDEMSGCSVKVLLPLFLYHSMVPPRSVPITISAKESLFRLPESITLGKDPVFVEMLCLGPKGDWPYINMLKVKHTNNSINFFITK
jgi:hypothetical protein